jgi:hypothetical protein
MFSGHRLHPWGEVVGSWNGEILSLPSASTHAGLVLISEKQPRTRWCSRTVSMKKAFASLTTFRSHLQRTPPDIKIQSSSYHRSESIGSAHLP